MGLLALSLAPVVIIIIYIYYKDKYEKESKRILALTFMLGAVVSIVITAILYRVYDNFFPELEERSIWQQFIKAFIVVALVEEFSKYVVVRYFNQPRKGFNEPFDGIVYAVMVSMGFAAVENIFYAISGGFEVALLRAFTAVPAHASFAILMGYYMGMAKFSNKRMKLNLIGLGLAVLFHGAYDFFLFINFIPGLSIGAFVSLILGLLLSRKAIKIHQDNSHFKDNESIQDLF
jgi:RsiW-degrading membrane proteinase PrsW (M82 family)